MRTSRRIKPWQREWQPSRKELDDSIILFNPIFIIHPPTPLTHTRTHPSIMYTPSLIIAPHSSKRFSFSPSLNSKNSSINEILFSAILSINKVPFRWSVSCWKTTAPKPYIVSSFSSPNQFQQFTFIFLTLRTKPLIPGTERHPSQKPSVQLVKGVMTGLMTTLRGKGVSWPQRGLHEGTYMMQI